MSVEDFEARRAQSFWRQVRSFGATWDDMIVELNARTGVTV